MKILNLQQGTPEWHAARLQRFTASEAPAMMGASKYMTRTQLLDLKAGGIANPVTPEQQALFDRGHAAEAAARPIAERIVGEELFPVVGTDDVEGLLLLASFDGLTMLSDVVWEHKLFNADLASQILSFRRGDGALDDHYSWQLDQLLLVSGASRVLFMCSDGTEDNMAWMWYEADATRFDQLLAGWRQFRDDLAGHQIAAPEVKHEAEPIKDLPALVVQIDGGVKSSNIATYQQAAMAYIDAINTDLSTDDDFAQAEVNVKFCKSAESELDTVKKAAMAQAADIDELFRTIDHLKESLRSKRLTLEKLVKARKQQIKQEIVSEAQSALREHITVCEATLGGWKLPTVSADFAGAIKNKRTLASLRDATDTELARAKIEATEVAMLMAKNRAVFNKIESEFGFLFADIAQHAMKDPDDFRRLIDERISANKQAEAERIERERERIRQEEERKAREKAEAEERERLAVEAASHKPAEPVSEVDPQEYIPATATAAIKEPRFTNTPPDVIYLAPTDEDSHGTVWTWCDHDTGADGAIKFVRAED